MKVLSSWSPCSCCYYYLWESFTPPWFNPELSTLRSPQPQDRAPAFPPAQMPGDSTTSTGRLQTPGGRVAGAQDRERNAERETGCGRRHWQP